MYLEEPGRIEEDGGEEFLESGAVVRARTVREKADQCCNGPMEGSESESES